VVAPATATSRSFAFVVVIEDVCSSVVGEPAVSDPLVLWSTLQVAPEYSAMYRLESAPLPGFESAAVTVKLVPVAMPDAQYSKTLVIFAVGPP
jgi:hypothetical protein